MMANWSNTHFPPSLGSAQVFTSLSTVPTLNRTVKDDAKAIRRSGEWCRLQQAIVGLFKKKNRSLAPGELVTLHADIRYVLDSKAGAFFFDYYKQEMLNKGMIILREDIKLEQGSNLLKRLEETWDRCFTKILPTLEAILFPLKTHGSLMVRHSFVAAFRDVVVLKIRLAEALDEEDRDRLPNGICHMLLILQSVHDLSPLHKSKCQLESLVGRAVIPYLGFWGLYKGTAHPVITSEEPKILDRKKSNEMSGGRRISRPLSVQPKQHENLNDMFLKAVRKQQASSFSR